MVYQILEDLKDEIRPFIPGIAGDFPWEIHFSFGDATKGKGFAEKVREFGERDDYDLYEKPEIRYLHLNGEKTPVPMVTIMASKNRPIAIHKFAAFEVLNGLKGPGIVMEGASLQVSALVAGPFVIGERSTLGTHAMARGPVFIGNDVMYGETNTSVRSILMSNSIVAHSNSLADSVVLRGAHVSSFVRTANLFPNHGAKAYWHDEHRVLPAGRTYGTTFGEDCNVGMSTQCHPGAHIIKGQKLHSGVWAVKSGQIYIPRYEDFMDESDVVGGTC